MRERERDAKNDSNNALPELAIGRGHPIEVSPIVHAPAIEDLGEDFVAPEVEPGAVPKGA